MGVSTVHNAGINRLQHSTAGVHVAQGLLEAQSEEVQAWSSGGYRRHPGAKDTEGSEPRQACAGGSDGTGRAVQPVRCTLRDREPMGELGVAATDAVASAERKGAVGAGKLLPVQPHLCERHQRLDDCGLDAEGSQRDGAVQGGGLLQQQDRFHKGGDRQVESPPGDCSLRRAQQVGQGLSPGQGRTAEQSPGDVADGDPRSTEGLRAGPAAVLMPLLGPGGLVGAVVGELRIPMRDDADEGGGCTINVLQQLLNEDDGDMSWSWDEKWTWKHPNTFLS